MSMEALGRRLVACKHFRWVPGMVVYGRSVQPFGWLGRVRLTESHEHPTQLRDPWPDLADGATRGAVLALVREAWNAPHAAPQWDQRWQHWAVLAPDYNQECEAWKNLGAENTEAEALAVALEAAP